MDFEKLSQLPEYRAMSFVDFEARDDGWGFEGLATPYGEASDIGDFTEEFAPGAYRKRISKDNVRLAYDHSPSHVPVLATTRGGTLHLKEDVKGVYVKASIAKHYVGEAARELIQRGDIKGMSPGFIVGRGNSEVVMRNGKPHRIIRDLKKLIEISLTPDPAYAGTTAEMRSMWAIQMASQLDDMQHALMGGYAQLESRAVVESERTEQEEEEAKPAETTETVASVEETPAAEVRKCDTCDSTLEEGAEHECAQPDEQRSGVDATFDEAAHAARTRRLQMLGLTLPR